MKYFCYTDGSAIQNPGPGGWAWVVVDENNILITHKTGGVPYATNNQMELQAVIELLVYFLEIDSQSLDASYGLFGNSKTEQSNTVLVHDSIEVYTDSTYVQLGVTQWMETRIRRGWRRSKGGKMVANMDQRIKLSRLLPKFTDIHWKWTRAHVGNQRNEWVDSQAREQASGMQI